MNRNPGFVKLILFLCLVLSIRPVPGEISGSVHDFSGNGWSQGEICLPCHTPHNADTTQLDSPLWNHEVTTATFTVYSSPTLKVTPLAPRGISKLCLSCHDGTLALDSFGGNLGSNYISGEYNVGTDLSDDHPISIYWSHQNDLQSLGCVQCHNPRPSDTNSDLPFFDRYIECATCHDVHAGTSYDKLLRKTLQGSELCLYCHGK